MPLTAEPANTCQFEGESPTLDGYLWPPAEIGPLDEPIVLTFEAGELIDIGVGSDSRHLDGVMRYPALRLDGHVMQESGACVEQELAAFESESLRSGEDGQPAATARAGCPGG